MQTVSEEFKTAIASPSPEFKSRITFPGLALDDYQVRSINLDSLLVGSEDFEIGMAPMDMVQIELVYAPDEPIEYDFEDQECEIELGVNIPFTHEYMESFTYGELEQYTYDEMEEGTPENVALGLFTVERATKGVMILTLDCVDRMYKAEKEYVSDLMYPTTLLDILESACDQAGIELATTTFANSDYIVPNEPVYEGVTCRKVFAQVAELAGGYAKINRRGQLEIVTLGVTLARDITKDHYFDLKINEVAEASIDKVIVKVGEETATKGDGENIYTIVDNMFVQNPNNVVAPLYNVLKNVSYTACTLKWQGDFSLDLGDRVTIDGYETYILSRKLSYTGGLREDYSAPAKSNVEKNSTGKGNLILDINRVKTRIKVIDGEITETIERIEDVEGDISGLAQRVSTAEQKITADAIVQTVRESTAYQGDLAAKGDKSVLDSAVSTINQHATQISQRVEKNKIISEINQSAEEVQINANRLKIGTGTTFEQGEIYTWAQIFAGNKTWQEVFNQ